MPRIPFTQAIVPWMMGIGPIDYKDKTAAVQMYVRYMLARTSRMFKHNGLPESIPEYVYEMMLQGNGHQIVAEVNGDLYALVGTLSGFPDPYYRAEDYVVANPGLVENDLSLMMELVTGRGSYIIGAGSDADKLAADDFIAALWRGDLKAVLENRFIDGIKVNPAMTGTSQRLGQLIEAGQYISAKWFNALGLDSNYNMKRESLTANEVDMNSDSLLPLIDDMLECRKEADEKINKMFGLNVSTELSSSWKDNDIQIHEQADKPAAETEEVKDEQSD